MDLRKEYFSVLTMAGKKTDLVPGKSSRCCNRSRSFESIRICVGYLSIS
jgi:hypothetical protein